MSRVMAMGALSAMVFLTVSFGPSAAAEPSTPPGGVTIPITVENTATPVAGPTPQGERPLASTGADVISMLWAGFLLLAGGAVVIAVSRRLGEAR